ncbi:MAG: endonuclease/exonuclease/phosphatase family metal-dependent hydrolase [Akkermansiaceae bacterium]|jgi:endonuclease/exonuclease/phosphatase family metal-dependent hydrolase
MKRLLLLLLWMPAFAMAGEIKVTSYNIRQDTGGDRGDRDWSKRTPGVVKFLKNGSFSIIGLQEAKHNQVEDVQKGLPTFKLLGVGRADGKKGGEYSPLFYDPVIWTADPKEQGTFWLSDTPEVPGSMTWGNGVTRICSWARLIGKDGKAMYVYNTHWDHQSQPSREKAAELILKRIKARKHGEDPVIMMGDFNATTDNPAIKTLLNSKILIDHGGDDQKLTFNYWKTGFKPGLRIDHIFTSPSIGKAKFQVLMDGDPVNSDHNPVVLVIPVS